MNEEKATNETNENKPAGVDPLVKSLRLLEIDHAPDSYPAVQMSSITALLDEIEILRNQLADAPILDSLEADFERQTWTFLMPHGCCVGAGSYALVKI